MAEGNGIRFVGSLRKKLIVLWSIRAQHSWCQGLKACFPLPLVGFVVQNLGLWPGILSKRMSGSWLFWAGRLRARASNCRSSNLSFSRPSGSVLVRCNLVPVLRTLYCGIQTLKLPLLSPLPAQGSGWTLRRCKCPKRALVAAMDHSFPLVHSDVERYAMRGAHTLAPA